MQINDVYNKEEFSAIIINELKEKHGVKCKKEKRKLIQEKVCHKRIFRAPINLLELTDVILANGSVVQIPKFVADACNCILEGAETEGIFRKAGSSVRQKEIRVSLEAGLPLGKSHHVIDVANVIKYFFRELPEPVIPIHMQETMLRCLLIGESHVKAILLACLLLPPLKLNTLSFFMQFLYTVALSARLNKMSTENLAIIFTPSLMPFPNAASHRFGNHLKVVRLLIENANSIGTIPNNIAVKMLRKDVAAHTPSRSAETLQATQKKKKKRRSGSLTQMFNGLKKIVGSALGSSENLENAQDNTTVATNASFRNQLQQQQQQTVATPCLKQPKKRKFADPVCAFSAKKKKDLLALLPSNSGGFLPNTPMTKESKKSRLSLGGNRQTRDGAQHPIAPLMERRWSIVGTGWPKPKTRVAMEDKSNGLTTKLCLTMGATDLSIGSPSEPLMKIAECTATDNEVHIKECEKIQMPSAAASAIAMNAEYKAIKARVSAIETHISREFETLTQSCLYRSSVVVDGHVDAFSGPTHVQQKYEQVAAETEDFNSPTTERLAKRLSRELQIRRSLDRMVIRSPSARKIGTIRRRSQEMVRLSRNRTWHISSTSSANNVATTYAHVVSEAVPPLNSKRNLKREQPNTLLTGLTQKYNPADKLNAYGEVANEEWTAGDVFFNSGSHKSIQNVKQATLAPNAKSSPPTRNQWIDSGSTPMPPPLSAPRRPCSTRTPISTIKACSVNKQSVNNRFLMSTPVSEETNGRASIARLRSQNAGMVLAKAKLFDGLGGKLAGSQELSDSIEWAAKQTDSSLLPFTGSMKEASVRPLTQYVDTCEHAPILRQMSSSHIVNKKKNSMTSPILVKSNHCMIPPAKRPQELFNARATNDELVSASKNNKPNGRQNKKDSPRMTKLRTHLNVNSLRHVKCSLDHEVSHAPFRHSPRRVKSKIGLK